MKQAMTIFVTFCCLILSNQALAVPKAAKVQKQQVVSAKDKQALSAAQRYAKAFAQYKRLFQSYIATRKKITSNKAKIKRLEAAIKAFLNKGQTIHAKKGCPLGPKGRYCRWAKKKARIEARLEKLRERFKNL
jgi:hypothetical protein